jgi:hypothetical protein
MSFTDPRTEDPELRIQEARFVEGSVVPSPDRKGVDAVVDLICEGFGNERDNHHYGAGVLRESAALFGTGRVKMYLNHLDDETRRKLRGLPRPVEHVGGRILESWVAQRDDGKQTIRSRVRISHPLLVSIVEADPELLGVSIDARGRAEDRIIEGRQARDVTRITRVVSADFVTEAGAGGKITELVEAFVEAQRDQEGATDMAPRPDAATAEPEVELAEEANAAGSEPAEWEPLSEADLSELEALEEGDVEGFLDGIFGEEGLEEGEVDAALEEGDLHPVVRGGLGNNRGAAARPGDLNGPRNERNKRGGLNGRVREALTEQVEARAEELAESRLKEATAAALQLARAEHEREIDSLREAHQAELDRLRESFARDLLRVEQRVRVARQIEGTDLPAPSQAALKESFFDRIFEAEVDGDGNVVKEAETVLTEAVAAAITKKQDELTEFREARVTGAGSTTTEEPGSGKKPASGRRARRGADDQLDRELGIKK